MIYHFLICDNCKGEYKSKSADKDNLFFDDTLRLKANAEVNGWKIKKASKKGSETKYFCPACKKNTFT